jgi:hypothetical protein
MLRTVPLSIIRSLALYTQQNLCGIYHYCVYSDKIHDDGQRNCSKHVEFYSKNKFEKLVHLVGFFYKNLTTVCFFFQVYRLKYLRGKWKKEMKLNRLICFKQTEVLVLKLHMNLISYNLYPSSYTQHKNYNSYKPSETTWWWNFASIITHVSI